MKIFCVIKHILTWTQFLKLLFYNLLFVWIQQKYKLKKTSLRNVTSKTSLRKKKGRKREKGGREGR